MSDAQARRPILVVAAGQRFEQMRRFAAVARAS